MRLPADPVKAVADHLRRAVPEADAGAQLPEDWQPETRRPFLLVGDDGGTVSWPISTRHTLRVAAFARGRTTARRVAAQAQAALLDAPVPDVAYIGPASAVVCAKDSHNHAWLAAFTAEATARTILHPDL